MTGMIATIIITMSFGTAMRSAPPASFSTSRSTRSPYSLDA
jgi:hypothetical protein